MIFADEVELHAGGYPVGDGVLRADLEPLP